MRSSRAKGAWSLLHRRNKERVSQLVYKTAQRCHVRLYQFANVGNHLHFLVKTPSREEFQRFLRILPAVVSMAVTGARKGVSKGRFWDQLAYSRVVSWGREFKTLQMYLAKNILEGIGLRRKRMFLELS